MFHGTPKRIACRPCILISECRTLIPTFLLLSMQADKLVSRQREHFDVFERKLALAHAKMHLLQTRCWTAAADTLCVYKQMAVGGNKKIHLVVYALCLRKTCPIFKWMIIINERDKTLLLETTHLFWMTEYWKKNYDALSLWLLIQIMI